jgi:hypothetical protein
MIVLPEYSDIKYFISEENNLGRSSNDHNNHIRENIIRCMYFIDEDFYTHPEYGLDWIKLKTNFDNKMREICPNYHSYKITHKAGRRYNYDYIVSFIDKNNNKISDEKLEFKYNALNIDETPQFVSPMKPSKYLSQSFEEFYYDNYLVALLQEFELPVPERNIYLKTIHDNKPKCMEAQQLLYYQGSKQSSKYTGEEKACKFYQRCIDTSRECIKKFISFTELDIEKMSDYLLDSQDGKKYLLYKNGEFNLQIPDTNNYRIVSCLKNPEKYRYEATIQNNHTINILLRWKNGNGIAYPSFQIS